MRKIFDISQNSFACVKNLILTVLFRQNITYQPSCYIYTELIHQWLGVAHYDSRGPHKTTPLEK